MIEGLRQILGEPAFQEMIKRWTTNYRYGNADEAAFIALNKQVAAEKSGFEASNLAKLDLYFQQWLHGVGKPTLTPTTFFQSTSVPNVPVSGTVPATLSLTLGAPVTLRGVHAGHREDLRDGTTGTVISTAGDATLTVAPTPAYLVNGTFALPEPLQVTLSKSAWTGPTSNEAVGIGFKQLVKATDPLRTGTYSKTLTYTLSTTTP